MWNQEEASGVYNTMPRITIFTTCTLLFLPSSLLAQQVPKPSDNELPCAFKGELFESAGKPKWLKSDEMKQRAVHKVDVGPLAKNLDISATTVSASLIIVPDGSVKCLKILTPQHPLIVSSVVEALSQWKFKQMKNSGRALAYIGRLEFQFCRMFCAEGKNSVTLLD